jgi:hypothetical protein
MRSPAESLRRALRVEGLLRGVAAAALVAAIVASLWQLRGGGAVPAALHVDVTAAPSAVERDSLAALARAGRSVTWSGDLLSVMAVAEPLREPLAAWRVAVVGDGPLVLRDSLDVLDSIAANGVLTTEPTRGPVQADEAGTVALADAQAADAPAAILVMGRVGWEPRFAMSALEESGWSVDARLELGRDRRVRQGAAAPSRARHGVVIVFDSASVRRHAAALRRFVAEGGGVILGGDATLSTALPPPRDSIAIALGDSLVHVLGRRVGRGRVIALPEPESWRWRMQGEGAAVEAHRTFWSRLVGLAMPVGSIAPSVADASASAPRAALVQALGSERPAARRAPLAPTTLPWWLGPLILLVLLTEWASRRRRGVP